MHALPRRRATSAKNKVGPILNGIDGRKSGSEAGYSYSDANKNSGITWSEQTFKEYITDPKAKVPGTKMVFAGIKNDKERDDLWSYLAQFKADGQQVGEHDPENCPGPDPGQVPVFGKDPAPGREAPGVRPCAPLTGAAPLRHIRP